MAQKSLGRIENSVKLGMNRSQKGHTHMCECAHIHTCTHTHTHTHTETNVDSDAQHQLDSIRQQQANPAATTDLCGGGTRRQPTSQWGKFIIKLQHIHTQFPLYF